MKLVAENKYTILRNMKNINYIINLTGWILGFYIYHMQKKPQKHPPRKVLKNPTAIIQEGFSN